MMSTNNPWRKINSGKTEREWVDAIRQIHCPAVRARVASIVWYDSDVDNGHANRLRVMARKDDCGVVAPSLVCKVLEMIGYPAHMAQYRANAEARDKERLRKNVIISRRQKQRRAA